MTPLPAIILNLIVGLPCAYMFGWLFPPLYDAQQILAYTQSTDQSLILMVSIGILFIGLYGLVASYCLFTAGYEMASLYLERTAKAKGSSPK
jgi:ATP/ADP translocase